MKKQRMLSLLLALAMVLGLAACSGGGSEPTSAPTPSETADAAAQESSASETETEEEVPETTVIRWARGNSGNAMVTVAKKLGYFDEVGLTVEEIPLDATADAFAALAAGQVDVLSNYGTNQPLQYIATGEDVVIFGGHMITGCMPIIAKAGTEWNGIEDFVGKTIAAPASTYAATGALLELGHDPMTEVEWLTLPNQSDRVAAVVSGEADYGVIGTGQMYSVLNMDDIDIMCYLSDVMPNYSCCRMETRSDFIENNPTTVKLLLKALLRAQCYYESHKEEVVGWMAEELGTTEDYVAAYMLNEHYRINLDPSRQPTHRAWEYMAETGFLDDNAAQINLDDHINTELYKQALDETIAEHYDEDPEFYDSMLEFYEANN